MLEQEQLPEQAQEWEQMKSLALLVKLDPRQIGHPCLRERRWRRQ